MECWAESLEGTHHEHTKRQRPRSMEGIPIRPEGLSDYRRGRKGDPGCRETTFAGVASTRSEDRLEAGIKKPSRQPAGFRQ